MCDSVECSTRGLGEVAESDFTKLLAEAETAENQAVAAFRKLADEDELCGQVVLRSSRP